MSDGLRHSLREQVVPRAKDALRPALTRVNRVRAERRLAEMLRAPVPSGGYRVEIGAGPHRVDGWVATDVTWNCPYWLDATAPWPFPRGSVRYVYGDNVIEHITLDQNRKLFREARAVMAPGATIRLCTPDVGRLVDLYCADDGQTREVLDWHQAEGHVAEHRVDLLRVAFNEHGHHVGYLWDMQSLSAELVAAGFVDARRCETNESRDPLLRGLEVRDSLAESAIQLNVEADVPGN